MKNEIVEKTLDNYSKYFFTYNRKIFWRKVMNKKYYLVFMVLFMNILNIFPQSSDLPKVMYINTANGLRGRSEPSTNSTVVKILLHGQRIVVWERSTNRATIDGITDYWYKTTFGDKDKNWYFGDDMWLFGGYLSENIPLDVPVILGKWHYRGTSEPHDKSPGKEPEQYNFYADGSYRADDYFIYRIGTWSLRGNIITIMSTGDFDSEYGNRSYETQYVQINIIDRNNINLIWPEGKVTYLERCNDAGYKN
jgi:hypothetical protein